MATPKELEARIKLLDWAGLRTLWAAVKAGRSPGWEEGEALEYLVLRAFELDRSKPIVRYPYDVPLFGEKVEEIDGAVHLPGLGCLVETKDWEQNVPIGPIVKMRSQLLRRPGGMVGLMFAKQTFTRPAVLLAHFTMPQAILLWSGWDIEVALEQENFCDCLWLKYQVCCESGLPDYDLRERAIP